MPKSNMEVSINQNAITADASDEYNDLYIIDRQFV